MIAQTVEKMLQPRLNGSIFRLQTMTLQQSENALYLLKKLPLSCSPCALTDTQLAVSLHPMDRDGCVTSWVKPATMKMSLLGYQGTLMPHLMPSIVHCTNFTLSWGDVSQPLPIGSNLNLDDPEGFTAVIFLIV